MLGLLFIYFFYFSFFNGIEMGRRELYNLYISRRRRYSVRILLGSQTRGIDRDGDSGTR